MVEESSEVKLPTILTDERQRWEEPQKRREEKRRREEEKKRRRRREEERRKKIKKENVSEERRSRCAKRQESRETLCFSNDLSPRRVESRLAKASPAGQMRDEKLHAVKHISKSKCTKHTARSTFRSQNVQNTSAQEHF